MANELKRVLHVEDDPDIQAVAKIALETVGGLEVLMCSGGAEALGAVEAFNPDIVLLDVMMPGMDGPATLKALQAMPAVAHIPVIFITAKTQAREVSWFLELGAKGIIPKPFDPMTLAAQVRKIWEQNL